MDGSSVCMIDTRIVYGFPGAGKTSYIQDCIRNDYFYKYGTTLILCFEKGAQAYDETLLPERNASVAYYDGEQQIREFCSDQIERIHPERIYVEMSTKYPDLKAQFPEEMHVTSTVTWFDWSAMEEHFASDRQLISQMVTESQQITFRGCPSRKLLAPYSQEFQLMNHRASYLRQDPMGYHEKAFELFLPYSLDTDAITIRAKDYLVFWLDAAEHPEHYDGKRLCFTEPLELRHIINDSVWSAGRVVMTCCMADLQFMSFELGGTVRETFRGGWIALEATGQTAADEYGRKILKLVPVHASPASAPERNTILQASRRLNNTAPVSAETMFQRLNKK